MEKRQWSDLTRQQQTAVVALGAVELVVTCVALVDLARRPADEVKGPKALWAMACFIQPIGAPSYLIFGRRRSA